MKNRLASIGIVGLLVTAGFLGFITFESEVMSAKTLYVGGIGPLNYSKIQDAINAANPGDTVYVFSGTYYENVIVNKTINLTGENRDTTIINASGIGSAVYISADRVNIKGFTAIGPESEKDEAVIMLDKVRNCRVIDNKPSHRIWSPGIFLNYSDYNTLADNIGTQYRDPVDGEGIYLAYSNNNIVINNTFSYLNNGIAIDHSPDNTIIKNNLSYNRAGIMIVFSSNNTIVNNTLIDNYASPEGGSIFISFCSYGYNTIIGNTIIYKTISSNSFGIWVQYSSDGYNTFVGNNISSNHYGIYITKSSYNTFIGNTIFSNRYGIDISESSYNTFIDNSIFNNNCSVYVERQSSGSNFINCSLTNPTYYDFNLTENSHATTLNTTFDDTKIMIEPGSTLTVKNYLHVLVLDATIAPISGVDIEVTDNGIPIYQTPGFGGSDPQTGGDGFVRWIAVTDRKYIGSNIATENITTAEISYPTKTFTDNPRDVNMSSSHTEIFIEVGAKFIILYEGWNLISIPYIQPDTNLDIVLNSIKGSYDAVQWYNVSDSSDPWKHSSIKKPSHLNDLDDIHHMMGFWIHITQPGGILFQYSGIQPIENQSITLHPGWNLVGYPSLISYNRTKGLNNITFDKDVDSIWAYDTLTQKWKEIGPTDYFEIGRGYWIHAKTKCEWEVPL
jgi:parallel beta-helix repeat protein